MQTASVQNQSSELSADKNVVDIRDHSINGWLTKHEIKNEKGDAITFHQHLFLQDIYEDQSQNLVVLKAAQVGLSTLEVLKNMRDAKMYKMDIIYTLPTDGDVSTFVKGKVNRIIAANPILQEYTKDADSIEQKQVGESIMYFRGTWTASAANMIPADRLVHDEKDTSKQQVISDYQARMQHSKYKQTHVFSHPSNPGVGVDIEWQLSDQKEWFIKCPHCDKEQYMSWDMTDPKKMSVDLEKKEFICKKCRGVLGWKDRAIGRWVPRYKTHLPNGNKIKWSGYHISLLMAPWITAEEIIDKWNDAVNGKSSLEFFYTRVLGLPYAGSGNSVSEETIKGLVTTERNSYEGRLVVGVDPGGKIRYVVGNKQGILGYGEMKDYMPDHNNALQLSETLEYFLVKFPTSIMVIDSGGDLGQRKLRAKYPGRVFLCHYRRDRKTMQLIAWGEGDESGNVVVDRNRMIQFVIEEARNRSFNLYNGTREDYHDYWLHWSHIYRKVEDDSLGVPQYVWLRSDRDDYVHCTVYWRVGIQKFGGSGKVFIPGTQTPEPNSYQIKANQTVEFNPEEMFKGVQTVDSEDDEEWR